MVVRKRKNLNDVSSLYLTTSSNDDQDDVDYESSTDDDKKKKKPPKKKESSDYNAVYASKYRSLSAMSIQKENDLQLNLTIDKKSHLNSSKFSKFKLDKPSNKI